MRTDCPAGGSGKKWQLRPASALAPATETSLEQSLFLPSIRRKWFDLLRIAQCPDIQRTSTPGPFPAPRRDYSPHRPGKRQRFTGEYSMPYNSCHRLHVHVRGPPILTGDLCVWILHPHVHPGALHCPCHDLTYFRVLMIVPASFVFCACDSILRYNSSGLSSTDFL